MGIKLRNETLRQFVYGGLKSYCAPHSNSDARRLFFPFDVCFITDYTLCRVAAVEFHLERGDLLYR